jgi:hypothetical protein
MGFIYLAYFISTQDLCRNLWWSINFSINCPQHRRLREQSLFVQQLIAAFGLDFRVAYTPAAHPAVTIVVALRDIDFQVLILGNFRLVNVPPPRSLLPQP